MSHDIDDSTGQAAMAYVGAEPWHGLGEKLPPGQPIEVWKQAARLDWRIQMVPVQYQFEGRARVMAERFVLTRDDTGSALSVVSGDYQVVQPAEVLEFYRDLVAQRHYTLETAGALDGGRKVWAPVKLWVRPQAIRESTLSPMTFPLGCLIGLILTKGAPAIRCTRCAPLMIYFVSLRCFLLCISCLKIRGAQRLNWFGYLNCQCAGSASGFWQTCAGRVSR